MNILKLTNADGQGSVRINFDLVAFYNTVPNHINSATFTSVTFVTGTKDILSLAVKETPDEIDKLLGISPTA